MTLALLAISHSPLLQHAELDAQVSAELEAAFGFRRSESIKFQPEWADRGDKVVLKSGWTKGGREREDETIIFDSTGMALQDVAAAAIVYERAVARGRGTAFDFAAF